MIEIPETRGFIGGDLNQPVDRLARPSRRELWRCGNGRKGRAPRAVRSMAGSGPQRAMLLPFLPLRAQPGTGRMIQIVAARPQSCARRSQQR